MYVILEYPHGRTVTFSSIESNDFDHITEVFMGTRGTLVIGYEGDVLLYGDKGNSLEASATTPESRATQVETTPRAGGAVLEASESRLADARGGAGTRAREVDAGNDPLLSYRLEIATFCGAIRTGVPLRCGVTMAFNTTVACLAANEAIDKKMRVDVPTLT